ncbi:MAG: hypothetical protein AAGB51_09520 [Planctomycetota bacterium]
MIAFLTTTLLTAATQPEPNKEELGRGLTMLYLLALVGVLLVMLPLLAFSLRRITQRKLARSKRVKPEATPGPADAWTESAERMPTPSAAALEDEERPKDDDLV